MWGLTRQQGARPRTHSTSSRGCGGPAALVKLNRHKGLETADGPGHSPAHRHCPASTVTWPAGRLSLCSPTWGHRDPVPAQKTRGPRPHPGRCGHSLTPALRGAVTGVSLSPTVASTEPPPQGLIGGGLQPRRAWSGRVAPAEGIGRWRRRQAGRLAQRGTPHFLQDEPWSELWAQLRPREEPRARRNPPAARPLTGCHRGRAGSARRGRWSRRSGR